MPDPRHSSARTLLVVDRPEASYRYANGDRAETTIVLAGPDGSFEVDAADYDEVLVIGFADRPAVLRGVVDRVFTLVAPDGPVLVGASAVVVSDDAAAWSDAFAGLGVTGLGAAPAPAVVMHRGAADDSTGAYLRGALAAIAATTPVPVAVLPPVDTTPAPTEPHPVPTSMPAPGDQVGRLKRVLTEHRRPVLAGAAAVVVALLVAVGLVALLNEFFLAVMLTLILGLVVATGLRLEQRGRRVEQALSSVGSVGRAARKGKGGSGSPSQSELLLTLVQEQSEEMVALRKSMAVSELATVEVAKILEELRTQRRTDPVG